MTTSYGKLASLWPLVSPVDDSADECCVFADRGELGILADLAATGRSASFTL